jgi:hypothetical protein
MSHGSWDGGGAEVCDGLGDAVGDGDRVGLGAFDVGGAVTPPVQVTPLSAKLDGTGLEVLFQLPLNPKLALPPVGMLAL